VDVDVGGDVGEDFGEDVGEDFGEDVGEDVGENVGEDIEEDVGEDVGEDVPVFEFEIDVVSAGRPKKRMGTPKAKVAKKIIGTLYLKD
jgi:hypothetical protein